MHASVFVHSVAAHVLICMCFCVYVCEVMKKSSQLESGRDMGRIEKGVTGRDLREGKERGSNETLFQLKHNRLFLQ